MLNYQNQYFGHWHVNAWFYLMPVTTVNPFKLAFKIFSVLEGQIYWLPLKLVTKSYWVLLLI